LFCGGQEKGGYFGTNERSGPFVMTKNLTRAKWVLKAGGVRIVKKKIKQT